MQQSKRSILVLQWSCVSQTAAWPLNFFWVIMIYNSSWIFMALLQFMCMVQLIMKKSPAERKLLRILKSQSIITRNCWNSGISVCSPVCFISPWAVGCPTHYVCLSCLSLSTSQMQIVHCIIDHHCKTKRYFQWIYCRPTLLLMTSYGYFWCWWKFLFARVLLPFGHTGE